MDIFTLFWRLLTRLLLYYCEAVDCLELVTLLCFAFKFVWQGCLFAPLKEQPLGWPSLPIFQQGMSLPSAQECIVSAWETLCLSGEPIANMQAWVVPWVLKRCFLPCYTEQSLLGGAYKDLFCFYLTIVIFQCFISSSVMISQFWLPFYCM